MNVCILKYKYTISYLVWYLRAREHGEVYRYKNLYSNFTLPPTSCIIKSKLVNFYKMSQSKAGRVKDGQVESADVPKKRGGGVWDLHGLKELRLGVCSTH